MNDGGAGSSSKVIKSWTVKQERKTTHTAPQNWGGWYYLHSVHVGRPWLISRERTKPCCIMLGDADGSVFLPDVSVGVTAPLRSAIASVWCPPAITDSGTGCEPFETWGHYYLHSHFSQTETGAWISSAHMRIIWKCWFISFPQPH